jgi:penicillin amidase
VTLDLQRRDRALRADAAEPLLFAARDRAFPRLAYADELGPLFLSYWNIRPQFVTHILTEKPVWCDDQETGAVESCGDILSVALDQALLDLVERYGEDRSAWRWGEAHPAHMGHPIFDGQPVIETIFNIEQPIGGDSTTVNVGHYALWDDQRPFASTQAASYRGLYDLADLDRSRFIAATGQSGHPLSPHYRDLSELWAAGETLAMARRPDHDRRSPARRLTLKP